MTSKLSSSKKLNIIIILIFLFPFLYFFGFRAYNIGKLPFQSVSIQCDMKGKQKFINAYTKYVPKLTFPKSFKIKFKFFDGEYLQESKRFPFLDNNEFGYQAVKGQYIIKPSYNEYGDTYWIIFTKSFQGTINFAYIDYMTMGHYEDYDAFYDCRQIS